MVKPTGTEGNSVCWCCLALFIKIFLDRGWSRTEQRYRHASVVSVVLQVRVPRKNVAIKNKSFLSMLSFSDGDISVVIHIIHAFLIFQKVFSLFVRQVSSTRRKRTFIRRTHDFLNHEFQ